MLTTALIVAAAAAQAYGTAPTSRIQAPAPRPQAAPAVPVAPVAPVVTVAPITTPGRTLRDLPGATITHYDIAGTTAAEIQLALKTMRADPAAADKVRLYSWKVGTQLSKATTGDKCVVQGAKSTLTATISLPRLATPATVAPPVLANWNNYATTAENQATTDLWFLTDRLRGAEQSLIGMPCEQATPAWNTKVDTIRGELNAVIAQRAAAAAAAAAPTAVAPKPAG